MATQNLQTNENTDNNSEPNREEYERDLRLGVGLYASDPNDYGEAHALASDFASALGVLAEEIDGVDGACVTAIRMQGLSVRLDEYAQALRDQMKAENSEDPETAAGKAPGAGRGKGSRKKPESGSFQTPSFVADTAKPRLPDALLDAESLARLLYSAATGEFPPTSEDLTFAIHELEGRLGELHEHFEPRAQQTETES